ncbi:OsmC family protein [Legionella impletisoli]|uniref:Osmotically inducible protein OsmC n=1 Tax=Legionella impletisoli TaxID=343510 RepID=A0A917JVF6_9GAMM|nr:OsmC family protein [Legionella impletisoli]GGI88222.1 osmotically inducible protein OsmC [Legionella impletisoli]
MKRSATAIWEGGLKDGKGQLTTDSKILSETVYSFKDRFEEGKNTNPEELIAAAHAGCFSMALSGQLATFDLVADYIKTKATVTLEKSEDGFEIPSIHLSVTARVPNATHATFDKAAENAKNGCPVSKLMNAKIIMDAVLEE